MRGNMGCLLVYQHRRLVRGLRASLHFRCQLERGGEESEGVPPLLNEIDRLRQAIEERQLTRRDVLRRSIALGLSAPVIASLLAACGGDDDDDDDGGDETATEAEGAATEEMTEEAEETEAATDEETEAEETEAADETEAATEEETEAEETEAAEETETEEAAAGGERGGHGALNLLWWQAPTILNPHFSTGTKDDDASRPILQPLFDVLDDGSLQPLLAAEVPTLENGGLAEDGKSVTIKLREGVKWHDGEDFNAEDVNFTYEWVTSEGNTTVNLSAFLPIESCEIVDDYTVTVTFKEVNPAWMNWALTRMVPEHIMKDYMGAQASEAPFNLNPIGTGPYKLVEFKPGDVVNYELNPDYYEEGKPHFDTVSMKGGGDAVSAARAALQTGDVDYSWNLQVEADVLLGLSESAQAGTLLTPEGVGMERILVNRADPRTEVDGAFSEPSAPHPWQNDEAVLTAYSLLCDRDTMAEQLYGPAGTPTIRWLVAPDRLTSDNGTYEFSTEKAAAALEEGGWVLEDGVRTKDGVKIGILFQTSINTLREKEQELVKQAFEEVGMPVEIKQVDASVFFTADAGNPDNLVHFYADLQMYTSNLGSPYPIEYMANLASVNPEEDVAQKSNSWSGANVARWVNEEYNEAYSQARVELDEAKQAELFVTMNDLCVSNVAHIPLVLRADVSAASNTLGGIVHSRWDSELYDVQNWTREG